MTSTLFIVQIVLAVLITIVVLLQKSSSIGLGAYSGSNESLFGAKGPAGFLAKLTFTLGLLFVINTLALGYLYAKESKKSAVDEVKTINKVIPAPKIPAKPFKSVADTNKTKAEDNSTKTVTPKEDNSTAKTTENAKKESNNTKVVAPKAENNSTQSATPKKENNSTVKTTEKDSNSTKVVAPKAESNTTKTENNQTK